MDKFTEQYRRQFYQEAKDILEKANNEILQVEADPDNQELINSVFRGIHTIKGSAGSFELEDISDFTHYLESVLSALRDRKIPLEPDLVDVILAGTDHINKMIEDYESGGKADIDRDLIKRLESFSKTKKSETQVDTPDTHLMHGGSKAIYIPLHPEVEEGFKEAAGLGLYVFRVKVKYSSDLFENGYDPMIFLNNLKQSCTFYYADITDSEVVPIDEFNPLRLYLYPFLYVATALSAEEIMDLTFDPSLIVVEPVYVKLDKLNSEPLNEFIDGAVELLESMEKTVIDYETSGSREALNEIFRAVHNLKGDADMVGLENITLFAHALETLLERLRSGAIQRTFALVDAILQSVDFLRQCVIKLEQGIQIPDFPPVFETLKYYSSVKEELGRKQDILQDISADLREVFNEQALQYKEILEKHSSTMPLDRGEAKIIKRALKGITRASGFVGLASLGSQAEKAIDALMKNDGGLSEALERIIAFLNSLEPGKEPEPVSNIVIRQDKTLQKDTSTEARTMRVDERKVDHFTNMIGELLIARNTYEHLLSQVADIEGPARKTIKALKDNLHLFSSLTSDIHHGVMSLRMIPVRRIFRRFNRVVRDISRKQKKSIQLFMDGEEIEIDKKVADMLSDPLVHMVRNACDHGIELPEQRRMANKPEKGSVIIRASHEGTNLCISVIDDGRGIDRQKLYEKAQSLGIETEALEDSSFHDLVFTPGLSTSSEVSDISGRGVGLDVVKTTVRSLGGSVRLVSNEGQGMEATLSIPITFGIDTVLFVEAGKTLYAFPLENIVEILKLPWEKLKKAGKQRIFHHRGEVLPAKSLEALLANRISGLNDFQELERKSTENCSIVIVKTIHGKFGLIIDRLGKNMEVAIKPPPMALAKIDIISGVTIMGDGKVFLVINPDNLF
ncbi:chemotaxis protein CheA [Desulfobacterales bacterium HSG16]|nr:chemotaxis protein CheA [Desulfobacterales bacterium HSG16]